MGGKKDNTSRQPSFARGLRSQREGWKEKGGGDIPQYRPRRENEEEETGSRSGTVLTKQKFYVGEVDLFDRYLLYLKKNGQEKNSANVVSFLSVFEKKIKRMGILAVLPPHCHPDRNQKRKGGERGNSKNRIVLTGVREKKVGRQEESGE